MATFARSVPPAAWLVSASALGLAGCTDLGPVSPDPGGAAPEAASFDSAVPRAWFDLALTLTRTTPGFTPPVASRAFGYEGLALYEALVPGMPEHRSLAGVLTGFAVMPDPDPDASYHWPSVANAALAEMMRRMYPATWDTNLVAIADLEATFAADFADDVDAPAVAASVAWGRAVAGAVHDYSRTDGGHEGWTRNFPSSYVPPAGPGLWVPTGPQLVPMQPTWGDNRCFTMPAANPNIGAEPGPPPAYSEDPASPFRAGAEEVRLAVSSITAAQRAIAEFWADDPGVTATPAGHSISILNRTLADEGSSLAFAAEAYAKLGMAVSDAFVCCWHSKYRYNLVRPITYIRDVIGDAGWNSIVSTPPFPEYTSGHSVQSGAMAAVMTSLFGPDYVFTDRTHDTRMPPLPARLFPSFDAAAEEAAISRLYGGIHYRAAIERGLVQGKAVGAAVTGLPFRR